AFYSLHGELSPGDSLFYVVSAQLYRHLYQSTSAGMFEVGTISTPGSFNLSFAYNNPAAQVIDRDFGVSNGDWFDMSGGVFVSLTSSGSGTSWVSVDPGFGATSENSGVVFRW